MSSTSADPTHVPGRPGHRRDPAAVRGIIDAARAVVGRDHVLTGEAIPEEATHDESLTVAPVVPIAVVLPADTAQVAAVVRTASLFDIPITARGSATGLSGGCTPDPDGIVVSFERMDRIIEIDPANHVAVVQPGVTLEQLDAATAEHGLVYPVFPGESSATLGGNVATNAGGMRAVKYGVTRHQVLGLEARPGAGEVLRTGRQVREGDHGLRPHAARGRLRGNAGARHRGDAAAPPAPAHRATVLAPFATLEDVTTAVPHDRHQRHRTAARSSTST